MRPYQGEITMLKQSRVLLHMGCWALFAMLIAGCAAPQNVRDVARKQIDLHNEFAGSVKALHLHLNNSVRAFEEELVQSKMARSTDSATFEIMRCFFTDDLGLKPVVERKKNETDDNFTHRLAPKCAENMTFGIVSLGNLQQNNKLSDALNRLKQQLEKEIIDERKSLGELRQDPPEKVVAFLGRRRRYVERIISLARLKAEHTTGGIESKRKTVSDNLGEHRAMLELLGKGLKVVDSHFQAQAKVRAAARKFISELGQIGKDIGKAGVKIAGIAAGL